MKNEPRIRFFLKLLLTSNYCFLDLVKRKWYMTKEWVDWEKKNKSEEFEDCIFSEDNDHEVDDNDEVFLQVKVIFFCICVWYASSNH